MCISSINGIKQAFRQFTADDSHLSGNEAAQLFSCEKNDATTRSTFDTRVQIFERIKASQAFPDTTITIDTQARHILREFQRDMRSSLEGKSNVELLQQRTPTSRSHSRLADLQRTYGARPLQAGIIGMFGTHSEGAGRAKRKDDNISKFDIVVGLLGAYAGGTMGHSGVAGTGATLSQAVPAVVGGAVIGAIAATALVYVLTSKVESDVDIILNNSYTD